MAVNVQIPMATQPVDTATGIVQANTMQNQNQAQQNSNEQSTEAVLKAHYDNMDSREKSRLSSTVVGAAHLKSFLDNNDVEGAQNFLTQRKAQLTTRMAHGENIDTQETDYALEALQAGKINQLKNDVNGILAAGEVYGLTKKKDSNTYLEQFDAVKKAHPEWNDAQVQDYVYTRGNVGKGTVFDANGKVVNPPGAVASAAEKEGATKFAGEAGGAAGKQVVANDTAIGNLQNLKGAVTSAKSTLQKVSSTGPVFGRTGALAKDPDYINLQRDINEITLLAKDLYNLGSGQGFTDADRDFLQELAGGKYNRAESIAYALDRFDTTLANRTNFLQGQSQRYGEQYGGGNPQATQAAPAPAQPPAGGKVKVSNGKETFMIDATDLPAAGSEGFQQVQ